MNRLRGMPECCACEVIRIGAGEAPITFPLDRRIPGLFETARQIRAG